MQKITEIPQFRVGRRCVHAVTSSGSCREQTCSSTKSWVASERGFGAFVRHFSRSLRLDVSAHFSALERSQL